MTGGFGADYTFEATGSVAVMRQALRGGAHGLGAVHRLRGGGPWRDARRGAAPVDHRETRLRLLVRRPEGDATTFQRSWRRYLEGDIDVDPFISHRIPAGSDLNRGFELMEAQDGIRSVIELSRARLPALRERVAPAARVARSGLRRSTPGQSYCCRPPRKLLTGSSPLRGHRRSWRPSSSSRSSPCSGRGCSLEPAFGEADLWDGVGAEGVVADAPVAALDRVLAAFVLVPCVVGDAAAPAIPAAAPVVAIAPATIVAPSSFEMVIGSDLLWSRGGVLTHRGRAR